MGGNPISNYALIKYFRNEFDKFVLIHTTKTETISNNFEKLLNVEFVKINIKDKERDLNFIKDKVINQLKNLNPSFIHLNYTGGTKSMSIGTFLAIEELEVEKVYSDIDFASKKLFLASGEIIPKEGSVADNVEVTIDEFALLNSLEIMGKQSKNSAFYDEKFCNFLLDKCINSQEVFYENLWDKDKQYLKKLNWRDSLKDISLNCELDLSNNQLKKLQKFIKGVWLEEYIFAQLLELKDELKISDIAWNVNIKNRKNEFEVDIIVTKGYKVYLFSCTTDYKKSMIKNKFFEAEKRATQIGGIGAKSILVSLYNDEDDIKNEMQGYVGREQVDTLTRKHLLNKKLLQNALKKIFE
jgi:hypothetical protein